MLLAVPGSSCNHWITASHESAFWFPIWSLCGLLINLRWIASPSCSSTDIIQTQKYSFSVTTFAMQRYVQFQMISCNFALYSRLKYGIWCIHSSPSSDISSVFGWWYQLESEFIKFFCRLQKKILWPFGTPCLECGELCINFNDFCSHTYWNVSLMTCISWDTSTTVVEHLWE